jgi:hypothetical protein
MGDKMQILFENNTQMSPKLSIVLVDWSCRASFHILEYLKNQTIPREQYEIIWIEYYNKHSSEIKMALEECRKLDKPTVVDKWIVMGMPDETYYHKHLMYNIGILASKGEIITICDSDAVVSPTFVKNIIEAFQGNPNIVLHMDEVKNTDKRFYPFNCPALSQITGKGCMNWKNGTTIGLLDKKDFLHTRNYGACMCALRKDLIDIGGADEHISYLGHICGPYEITFRMVNAGKKEIWHQKEFLYHTWHPGTDGRDNYLGPHDGLNMSTTALHIRRTNRIFPFVENPAIRAIRMNENCICYSSLLSQAIPELEIVKWQPCRVKRDIKEYLRVPIVILKDLKHRPGYLFNHFVVKFMLHKAIIFLIAKQIYYKMKNNIGTSKKVMKKSLIFNFRMFFTFFNRMLKNNTYTVELCRLVLNRLNSERIKEFSIYCSGYVADILLILTKEIPVKIINIYDKDSIATGLSGYRGKIVIASFNNVLGKTRELKEAGIDEKNIVRLQ